MTAAELSGHVPTPVAGRLEGAVALVTGAARGLGRDIADRLTGEGATVALVDVRAPEAPLADGQFHLVCDVADDEQVSECLTIVEARCGGLDVLVNCAGLLSGRRSTLQVDRDEMHRYFDVNAVGPLLMSQAAHPLLKVSPRRGRIINVASRTFYTANSGQLAYIASKGALTGITRVLAKDFGKDGITVNAVIPAQVSTPGTREHSGKEVFEKTMSRQAIQEFVTGAHLAGLVAYLASPDAALVTGQSMVCDGGGLMR